MFVCCGSGRALFTRRRCTDDREIRWNEDSHRRSFSNGGAVHWYGVESEEAVKSFYDNYATVMGFIMRVDAFRKSMRDGTVVWRRLVCNKEGFRRLRPRRSESRKPRAITREGCKALIIVKREKSVKWVVTKFVKEHNHPLLPLSPNVRRNSQLSQTSDEKDAKIRELRAELSHCSWKNIRTISPLTSIMLSKVLEKLSLILSSNPSAE